MTETEPILRVAILGGGLAGAAVFRGLAKHSHLRVDIFESAPVFREQGAGIGFNNNAIWALELLGLRDCLSDAGAVRIGSTRYMIGQGPESGKKLIDMDQRERGTWITQRASFLDAMYKGVDRDAMHAGKKLLRLEEGEKGITLFFEDGTTHVCDVLLGADGIHSKTRSYVLGEGHPAVAPVFGGWWTVWMLKPYEEAVKHLTAELVNPEDPRQYGWIGPNAFVMHDLVADNTMVQCVIAQRVPEDSVSSIGDWKKTATREELREILKDWDPRLQRGMVDLVTEGSDSADMFSLWHHKPCPSIVRGSIGLVGDAAGATTPWQGSGGGMSIEDAYLLSELFAHVRTVDEAKAALSAYDQVNRPRRQRLTVSSYETGLLSTGCSPGVEMNSEKLTTELEPKWDWIVDVDLQQNRSEVLRLMQEALA